MIRVEDVKTRTPVYCESCDEPIAKWVVKLLRSTGPITEWVLCDRCIESLHLRTGQNVNPRWLDHVERIAGERAAHPKLVIDYPKGRELDTFRCGACWHERPWAVARFVELQHRYAHPWPVCPDCYHHINAAAKRAEGGDA